MLNPYVITEGYAFWLLFHDYEIITARENSFSWWLTKKICSMNLL